MMRRGTTVLVLTAALFVAGCVIPPQTAPPFEQPPAPAEAPHAALAVVVTDIQTGRPVAGASVTLHTGETGTTDAAGYIEWRHLALGGRGIDVTAAGYSAVFYSANNFTGNLQIPIALAPVAPPPPPAPSVPVDPPPVTSPWVGRLSIPADQRCFVDETGACQLPLIAHFGEAFSAYVRRPAEVEAQLRTIKTAGYDGIRFWDTLGYYDGAWKGREVMPWRFRNKSGQNIEATPGYYERLLDFIGLLKRLGLVAHHSRGDLNSASLNQVLSHTALVAGIYDAVGWDTLALFEGNNEDFQNGDFGPDGLRRIVAPAKQRGAITASSCPGYCTEEPADVQAYSQGFSVRYYHGSRDGVATDRLRHIFSTSYERPDGTPRLAWEGEPTGPNQFPGPGVTVNHTEDVEELALLAAERFLSRGAWTYMSQFGVFWNGPIERHAGFYAVPRLRAVLQAFAPDVMTWPTLVHGGRSEAALVSPTGYYGDPGVTSGPARINQAISRDRRQVVAIVDSGKAPRQIKNALGCTLDLTVVGVNADETIRQDTVTLTPGQSIGIEYQTGRLLLGRCQ